MTREQADAEIRRLRGALESVEHYSQIGIDNEEAFKRDATDHIRVREIARAALVGRFPIVALLTPADDAKVRAAREKVRELSGDIADCLSGVMPHDTLTYRGSLLHDLLNAATVLAAPPVDPPPPAAKNLVVAAVRLAIVRHGLATDDCPTIGDEDAQVIADDVWNALNGIGTCAWEPAPELLALAPRTKGGDAK